MIDDNDLVRPAMQAGLEHAGHCVEEAADGPEGVTLGRATSPDAVVCDLYMPGASGPETIRGLRACSAAPILAVSGGGYGSDRDPLGAALGAEADAALSKPFGAGELAEAVAGLLGRHPAAG